MLAFASDVKVRGLVVGRLSDPCRGLDELTGAHPKTALSGFGLSPFSIQLSAKKTIQNKAMIRGTQFRLHPELL